MKEALIAAAGALLLAPASAWACTQDVECGANGRCVKSAGAIYGMCVRDVLPNDQNGGPAPLAGAAPLAREHCAFDADCGAGRACIRPSANATGVCVKQR